MPEAQKYEISQKNLDHLNSLIRERLRKSILQEAIQGKLVPQDSMEESSSKLLERISDEKQLLLKEGKLKRKEIVESIIIKGDDNKYYEKFADGKVVCIDDEIPFEIPQRWEWARIRDISQSYIGLTYSPQNVSSEGTIVLRSSNIQNGQLDLNDIVRVNAEIPSKLYVEENDILICARNGSKKLVGKSAVIKGLNEPMTFGAFMAVCKTPLWEYVFCFLQSDLFFAQLRNVSGTTTINQLTQNNFNAFLIPIPPIEEQKRITSKCNTILPFVEIYGHQQEHLDRLNNDIKSRLRKSILQEVIQGKLVPQDSTEEPAAILLERISMEKLNLLKEGKLKRKDFIDSIIYKGEDNKYYEKVDGNIVDISEEIPFDLPETWEWCRFASIVHYRIGKTPARGEVAFWEPGTIPWVSISDMKDYGMVTSTKEAVSKKATALLGSISTKGTLLMSFKLTVGRTAILEIDAYHNEAIISIWPFVTQDALKNYLFYTLPILANLGGSVPICVSGAWSAI